MSKYIAYKRNILSDLGIEGHSIEGEYPTLIEAIMAFFTKYGIMPDEAYSPTDRNDTLRSFENVRQALWQTKEELKQAKQDLQGIDTARKIYLDDMKKMREEMEECKRKLDIAVRQREEAIAQIDTLHEMARKALAAINL